MSAQRKYVQHLAPFLVSLIPFCVCARMQGELLSLKKKQNNKQQQKLQTNKGLLLMPTGAWAWICMAWIESNKERCRNLYSLSHWEVGTCSVLVSYQKTPVITSLEEHTSCHPFCCADDNEPKKTIIQEWRCSSPWIWSWTPAIKT